MDGFASLLSGVGIGLATALTPENLLFCFIGVFLGTLMGVLPGIGALTAIAMLMPMSFYLDPATALIMMAGIYYGSSFGGSTASILINVPGTPGAAVVCLDGYPMARQGRAGVALVLAALASFFAGCVGILIMMIFSPLIASVALEFGATEYFALMSLGLIAAAAVSGNSILKGTMMVALGMFASVVGMDIYTAVPRFTFGVPEFFEGIGLVPMAMGLFGISEVIASARTVQHGQVRKVDLKSMFPTREDMSRSVMPAVRGTAVGSFFGIIPGIGSTVACFLSYSLEKKVAKHPERFGHGAVEGVVAPEASNNAADQVSFIPTLTLGIPGSATMALILGVLMIHGITPGPAMVTNNPEIFWGLVMSFWVGNLMLLLLNIPFVGIWVRLLQIPYHYLYPAILMFVCIGVYAINLSVVDIWTAIAFGLLGYVMRVVGLPIAPMLLGFILGGLMEEHFRRALVLSGGDMMTFVERPLSGVTLGLAGLVLLYGVIAAMRRKPAISASA